MNFLLKKKSKNQLNFNLKEYSESQSNSSNLKSNRDIAKKENQLGQSKSNRDITTSSSTNRDAILAFRTITTMLSLIQSPTRTEVTTTGQRNISDAQRYELKVLDALSALVVRKHEIAAVMAKRYNGDKIQVLVSVNSSESAHTIPQQSQDSENSPVRSLFRWFITPNPRDPEKNRKDKIDSLTTRNTRVTLVDPNIGISEALSTADRENLLQTFLQTQWGNESFDTHIWMLKTLIGRSAQPAGRITLSLYVIAASFPKMLRRMHSNGIPKRYFDCLMRLKSKTFDYIEQPDIATTKSEDRDRWFLDIIPSLKTAKVDTDISNLMQMVEAKDTMKTPCEIYNKNTYMEFHGLLCELLNRFYESLKVLKHQSESTHFNPQEIMSELTSARILGKYLRAMVRSAAINKHLKTIAHLLDVDDRKSTGTTDEDAEEVEDTEDTEFHILKPYSIYKGQPILPWESYKDWLRLTTMYFDAIDILSKHIHSLSSSTEIDIDIKILAPSLPDKKMLPWKELLRHELYFPELSNDPEQTSSEDLISFLTSDFDTGQITEGTRNEREEGIMGKKGKGTQVRKPKGVSINLVAKSVGSFITQQEPAEVTNLDDLIKAIDPIIDQVNSLNDCVSPGWDEYTATILDQLRALKNQSLTPQRRLALSQEILEMLGTLRGHSLLYQMLKEGTPLSLGDFFSGTRHCEVFISSLSSLLGQPGLHDSGLGVILSEFEGIGQVIGVSKRCCPVCARLLKLLKTHDEKMFFATEEHSTITPCTLPEWLPANIIETMVVEFGAKLRRELVKLQKGTGILQRRTSSTDTRRISIDSMKTEISVEDSDSIRVAFQKRIVSTPPP